MPAGSHAPSSTPGPPPVCPPRVARCSGHRGARPRAERDGAGAGAAARHTRRRPGAAAALPQGRAGAGQRRVSRGWALRCQCASVVPVSAHSKDTHTHNVSKVTASGREMQTIPIRVLAPSGICHQFLLRPAQAQPLALLNPYGAGPVPVGLGGSSGPAGQSGQAQARQGAGRGAAASSARLGPSTAAGVLPTSGFTGELRPQSLSW